MIFKFYLTLINFSLNILHVASVPKRRPRRDSVGLEESSDITYVNFFFFSLELRKTEAIIHSLPLATH